jgi:hypothetical protein
LSEPCIVTASAQKLYGEDAAAWCEGFAATDQDRDTAAACESVSPTTKTEIPLQCEGWEPGTPEFNRCVERD